MTQSNGTCAGRLIPGPQHDPTRHLTQVFEICRSAMRPAFVAYTTAGFPNKQISLESIKALEKGGADIIEVGIPFTDPLADGTTIQRSNEIALVNGTTSLSDCLQLVKEARLADVCVPIVLMGYYNPFRAFGDEALMKSCRQCGVSGFIIVDLPPEESDSFRQLCHNHHLSFIPLITPTTTQQRVQHLVRCADSFIYAVSLTGVTGQREKVSQMLPSLIEKIRKETQLPVAVGFGIGNGAQFTEVGKMGDGVVVGSAIINCIERVYKDGNIESGNAELLKFCQSLTGRTQCLPVDPPLLSASPARSQVSIIEADHSMSRFGEFGGRYVPETLVYALEELERVYEQAKNDPKFKEEVRSYWDYIGRPSRCHVADRLSEYAGGARIWLKREDLNHTGAHKINNAIAQAILAKRLGKQRLIAETGAGQHGVATATICAKLGIPLTVYMGSEDVERQALNVFRMQLLGATVVPVESGSRTLKDAINEAMRDWVTNIATTHYLIGSAIGPHPFPTIVRDFQSVIGEETKQQIMQAIGKLPDAVIACVGGGSNAIGMFYPFKDDMSVRLIGVEAAGEGIETNSHSATLCKGSVGVLHGTRTYLLQHQLTGQINPTHSISAGLDYPGVGPEHSYLKDSGRAEYYAVSDREALIGFKLLTEMEGIIPALETSHAIYEAVEIAKTMSKDQDLVICVSGRGDKDIDTVRKILPKFGMDVTTKMQHTRF